MTPSPQTERPHIEKLPAEIAKLFEGAGGKLAPLFEALWKSSEVLRSSWIRRQGVLEEIERKKQGSSLGFDAGKREEILRAFIAASDSNEAAQNRIESVLAQLKLALSEPCKALPSEARLVEKAKVAMYLLKLQEVCARFKLGAIRFGCSENPDAVSADFHAAAHISAKLFGGTHALTRQLHTLLAGVR